MLAAPGISTESYSDVCDLALRIAEQENAQVQSISSPEFVDENEVYVEVQVITDKTPVGKLNSLMADAMAASELDFSVVVWFRTFEQGRLKSKTPGSQVRGLKNTSSK